MTAQFSDDLQTPSGYDTHETYFATRYWQGGRQIYSIDLSLPQLVQTIPRPDPTKPLEGNRQISLPRARDFAQYLRENTNAVFPPLLLQAPSGEFEFDQKLEVGGTEFGYLKIPKVSRGVTRILDGQHRSLGSHIAVESLEEDIRKARENAARAKRSGEKELQNHHERELSRLLKTRDRLAKERVALDIVVVDDPDEAKQIFVDIADNAKGITRDLTAMFDQRKVVNRVMQEAIKHELLFDRVDEGKAGRMGKNSPKLVGAKTVADIVRHVQVGEGRISARLEREYAAEEKRVVADTLRFLDLLVRAFPDFQDLVEGRTTAPELRQSSLLGSSTMLRVLAMTYHLLIKEPEKQGEPQPLTLEEIEQFFKRLAPHMGTPLEAMWTQIGVFPEGSNAPAARRQDIKKLTETLAAWARSGQPS